MALATLLLTLLLAPAASAEPAAPPEKAVAAVLRRMRAALRYAPDAPAPRGPHEWTGRRVLAAGTVNGCVEAAKAFQALYHDAVPGGRAVLVDSFDSVAEGGHAVVEVRGTDGVPLLVDAAAFERLPGLPRLEDADLDAPVDIRPDRKGRIFQFPGRDVFVEKAGGRYRLSEYPYGEAFSQPRLVREFDAIAALREAVAAYAPPDAADFRWLKDHGLLLSYDDASRSAFLYAGASGPSRHVVYACRAAEPERDAVVDLEPAARAGYARDGRGGCRR